MTERDILLSNETVSSIGDRGTRLNKSRRPKYRSSFRSLIAKINQHAEMYFRKSFRSPIIFIRVHIFVSARSADVSFFPAVPSQVFFPRESVTLLLITDANPGSVRER